MLGADRLSAAETGNLGLGLRGGHIGDFSGLRAVYQIQSAWKRLAA